MMKRMQKTGMALAIMLFTTMSALAEPQTYALKVDGLACPFCAFGIEKQLGRIAGVDKLDTDIKAGVVRLTMKDGRLLDEADAKQAVARAGFTLRGLETIKSIPEKTGESQ